MEVREVIARIANEALDLVYPPGLYCISCGKIIDASRTYGLCNDCMEAINWVSERTCEKCGRPLAENDPGALCFGCMQRESSDHHFFFDKGHACAGYGAATRSVIFAFKYGGRSDIGDILGRILYDRMAAEYGEGALSAMYDIVIPVPIYKSKQRTRGYNHADLMARAFSKRAGLRCREDILIRKKETVPMKGLSPSERQNNISGAFEIRRNRDALIKDKRILLIDDIFTTGATIDEMGAVMKAGGAARVDFLAFAAAADYLNA